MTKYLIFGAVSLTLLLSAINGTAIAVAFPVITSSFNVTLILAGWVLSIYQLVATAAQPLAGKASDALGRKNTFIACVCLFFTGSVLCAIAPSVQFLIFARFIQGIGGGGLMPTAAGIVAEEFPNSRQRAVGLISSIFPVGNIMGPILGGWLTANFGWRSIFWFNLPLIGIALLFAFAFLRPGKRTESRIDIRGSALFTGAIFSIMLGISQLGSSGNPVSMASSVVLLAAGILMIVVFLRHLSRTSNPILDPRVLKEKPFMASNAFNLIFGIVSFTLTSFIPLYAVTVYHTSLIASGFILTPKAACTALAAVVVSFFMVRWGYRRPILAGVGIWFLGVFLLMLGLPGLNIFGIQLSSTVWLLILSGIIGIAIGIVSPVSNNACIELMPEKVASIVGVRGMFRQSGGAIGIALTTLLLENVYDIKFGFFVYFACLAVALIITVPLVFWMPRSPTAAPSVKKTPDFG